MGALNKRRNFTLDQAWEVSDRTIVALEAVLGIPIGSDDGSVLYIQDVGVKELGYGYIDKITKKIYRCIVRTEEIVNSGTYFEDVSNNTMSNKLNNLSIIDELKYNGTSKGLTYNIKLKRIGPSCVIELKVHGVNEEINPSIVRLPVGWRPRLNIRLQGYGVNSDWIINTDGYILTSGGLGILKSNNDIGFVFLLA